MRKFNNEFELVESLRNDFIDHIKDVIDYDNEITNDFDRGIIDLEDYRDSLIEKLFEEQYAIMDNYQIYYATQFDVVNVGRAYMPTNDFRDNDLGIEVNSMSDLAFIVLNNIINERGIIYDAVDNYIDNN